MTRRLLYTSENSILLEGLASLLQSHDLHPELRNTMLAGAVGELAPIDTWPELWISEFEYSYAKELITKHIEALQSEDWQCAECGESNGANFERCWNCQADK